MKAKKFGAVAMALAMAGTMVPMSAFAEEEETQDFNGAEVRVFGNKWNELDPDAEGDKTQYLDAAAQIEEKYNIKFVYSRPDGYDGYNLGELIQAGITAGDAGVDILDSEPDALISLISSGALTDLTDDMDQIHVGSLYKQAVTWQDHCYGMTFDNVGDTYFMVYSRDYLEDIGMDVTPTEKFMAGEWSYDDMKEYFKDEVYEGINEIDGKLYYIPTCGTTGRLIYNKEIFERVGISEPPTTMEEMVEDARLITSQLSSEGIYGYAQHMKSASSALERSLDLQMERETGIKKGYDFAAGKYDFSQYSELLSYWKELLSEDCAFPGCESLDIDPLRTQFAAGKIGMYISWTHSEPGVYKDQFPMDSDKWGVAPIPTVSGEENGKQNIKFTSAYLINAKGSNVELAFQVYKDIFASEDFLVGYYEGGYGVSIIPSVVEKAQLNEQVADKEWLKMSDIDAVLPLTPQEKNSQAVVVEGEDYYKTFESIYYGDADMESTLQDLTDRYNAAYQKGISDGIGEEVKIEGYDPLNP